jgi:hypothetical protein
MPTKNPRINVVLEKSLYKAVSDLAKEEGMSLSMVTRDLLKEALELREDIDLTRFAETRDRTVKRGELLDHEDAWE